MNLREMESKCRDLFCLMDSFWEAVSGVNAELKFGI